MTSTNKFTSLEKICMGVFMAGASLCTFDAIRHDYIKYQPKKPVPLIFTVKEERYDTEMDDLSDHPLMQIGGALMILSVAPALKNYF